MHAVNEKDAHLLRYFLRLFRESARENFALCTDPERLEEELDITREHSSSCTTDFCLELTFWGTVAVTTTNTRFLLYLGSLQPSEVYLVEGHSLKLGLAQARQFADEILAAMNIPSIWKRSIVNQVAGSPSSRSYPEVQQPLR